MTKSASCCTSTGTGYGLVGGEGLPGWVSGLGLDGEGDGMGLGGTSGDGEGEGEKNAGEGEGEAGSSTGPLVAGRHLSNVVLLSPS